MTPEPEEIEEDYEESDYETPYPIDDRHLWDATYSISADTVGTVHHMRWQLDQIYNTYSAVHYFIRLVMYALVGAAIGIMVAMFMGSIL